MYRGKPLHEFEDWAMAAGESDSERFKRFQPGHSHYELAYSWATARGFPPEVMRVFDESDYESLKGIRFCEGYVEDPIRLPGPPYPKEYFTDGKALDQADPACHTFNDISVLGDRDGDKVAIAVEGKVSETFGKRLEVWGQIKGKHQKTDKREREICVWEGRKVYWRPRRLKEIIRFLGVRNVPPSLRIQLLYRAIGALGFAEQWKAQSAVLLVHSFSEQGKGLQDFQDFVGLFDAVCEVNRSVFLRRIQGIDLYAAWVRSEQRSARGNPATGARGASPSIV